VSYVDVQNGPSTVKLWEVRSMLAAIGRIAGRLCVRSAGAPALSAQWCEQYERDSAKR
jgi:hypothetical protein